MERYQRQIVLEEIGLIGQQKLAAARVLVVGAGGLGCPVLSYLAAAGVGTLGIVDFDTVEPSNLNRQILYTPRDIGQKKVLCAQRSIQALNPEIEVVAHDMMLEAPLAMGLFPNYDIIVDATDHIPTRYIIDDVAYGLGKPSVYGAIYKHEGQVAVFNHRGSSGYRCLFPEMPSEANAPNCATAGVLGALAGVIGGMQAYEVIKIALSHADTLHNQVIHYSSLNHSTSVLSIPVNPSRPSPEDILTSFTSLNETI